MEIHLEYGWHVKHHHQSGQCILSQLYLLYPARYREALEKEQNTLDINSI